MEGLALGASIVNAKGAKYLLTGASSHNTAVENNSDILLNMADKSRLLRSGQ